jgi:hypothetical protein
LFGQPAPVHDYRPAARFLDRADVMRNVQVGKAVLGLQALQQSQQSAPHGHIHRCGRLVQDEHRRPQDNGPCDCDTLTFSTAQVRRAARQQLTAEAHIAEHFVDPALRVRLATGLERLR